MILAARGVALPLRQAVGDLEPLGLAGREAIARGPRCERRVETAAGRDDVAGRLDDARHRAAAVAAEVLAEVLRGLQ